MKKKFLLSIMFLVFFLSIDKINAYTCWYKNEYCSANFELTKSSTGVSANVTCKSSKFDGYFSKGEKVEITNWIKSGYIITGQAYALINQCPEYVSVVRTRKSTCLDKVLCSKNYFFVEDTEQHAKDVINQVLEVGDSQVLKLENQIDPSKPDIPDNLPKSCLEFGEKNCETNEYFACIWVDDIEGVEPYCNTDKNLYVFCGDAKDIPKDAPKIISFIINLFKIATPIILILVSIIEFVKAVAGSKEDQIKKAQTSFIRRTVAAVLVFFVIYIVQFVILKVADDSEKDSFVSCLSCFMNNECSATYYKTSVGDEVVCNYVNEDNEAECTQKLTEK